MSRSEPKPGFNASDVCLPFAHPLVKTNGDIVWPFNQKGFALICGTINADEKCVEISDPSAIIVLQNMGYFGFGVDYEFNSDSSESLQQDDHKTPKQTLIANETIDSFHQSSSLFNKQTKSQSNHKHSTGKYVLVSTSVPNASIETNSTQIKSLPDFNLENLTKLKKSDRNTVEKDVKMRVKTLKLRFEESFFISYVFGSLNLINTETNNYMTIDEMWDYYSLHYSEDRLKFAVFYSAYHYFRSKGWVVRNGFSFGTDFLLYKEGPHVYHALYSVAVQQSIDGKTSPQFDWHYLSALIRLSQNVRKELLICVVNVPKNIDISSPNCIQCFEIELLHLDRWNASKGLSDKLKDNT